ncbi:MAG: hypothetical protein JWP42_4385 [Pseudomonas sp.]|nr:hypothetical protein [Pseudomonas sp.]
MTYELEFSEKAWKEWKKLGENLTDQFKKNFMSGSQIHMFRQTV